MSTKQLIVALAVFAFGLCGCSSTSEPADVFTPSNPPPPPRFPTVQDAIAKSPVMAIADYAWLGTPDDATLDSYAKADIVVLDMANFWSDNTSFDLVQALKDRNPQVRVIGYVNAHDSWLNWENANSAYFREWYAATRPYWSYSTKGDTMQAWPGKVLVNILVPECRTAMIDVLADHLDAHPSRIDGLFWDHFNDALWVPDEIPGVDGEVDLDGDGIEHLDDPDEQAAYRAASDAMIVEARSRLGGGLLQIANGNRAALDPSFAALLDGTFYENFPEVGFGGDRYVQALDPAAANNLREARSWLRTDNGGPWVILSNKFQFRFMDSSTTWTTYREAEFARVMALMTDTAVAYHTEERTMWGWPEVELNLGAPTGDVTITGQVYEREFERGKVTLTMKTGRRPVPFDFAIVQDGDTVQAFALPHHVP